MKWWGLGMVFAGSLAAAGWWFKSHLPATKAQTLVVQQPCDLQQGECTASDGQGHSVTLQLSPHPIPVMQPMTVEMHGSALMQAQQVQVVVEGVNMDMGFQRAMLTPAGNAAWQGQFTLPICSTEQMQWQLTAMVQTPSQAFRAVFPFITRRVP